MRRDNEYEIRVDVYGAVIKLWLTDSVQRAHKRFRRKFKGEYDFDGEGDAGGLFIHSDPDDKIYYLILERTSSVYYVAHECLHVTFHILDVCGVEYDSNNHEAFTYLHGYIVEQVDKRVERFRRKYKTTKANENV